VNEDRVFLAQPPDFQGIGLDDGLSMGSDDVLNAWQLFRQLFQSEFEKEVGGYFQFSKLKSLETVVDGLDQAVAAFIGLFDGKNVGKMVVKLS
jgi:hypothetical protein